MAKLAIGAVVVLAALAVGLAIWLLPRRQARAWRQAGITDPEKLAELTLQARTGITQAFGGLALIATLAITAYQVTETKRSADRNLEAADRNLRLAERGQVSERFSRAVEQLGATNQDAKRSPAIDVRSGALYSLRRIALDSRENTEQAFLVIAAYIRNNYKPAAVEKGQSGCARFRAPDADIQTAFVFVLPDVSRQLLRDTGGRPLRGLRGTRLDGLGLDGLDLERLDLTQLKLRDSHLEGAVFRGSTLTLARFDRADLTRANFSDTRLAGSSFRGACLDRAVFAGAHLNGADFTAARITRKTRLRDAHVDGATFPRSARPMLTPAQRTVVHWSGG